MKRIVCGIGWFFVFYFGILFFLGGIAGAFAAYQNNAIGFQEGGQVGYEAGQAIAEKSVGFVLFISVLMSVIGSATGKLPGTKISKESSGGTD